MALFDSLAKTRNIFLRLVGASTEKADIEGLEEMLLEADCGVDLTEAIVEKLKKKSLEKGVTTALSEVLISLCGSQEEGAADFFVNTTTSQPMSILLVGVNGAGKTTSIGKLAQSFIGQRKKVLVASADTFRAAAISQLAAWAERVGVNMFTTSAQEPASVLHQGLEHAKSEGYDVFIGDTAGRQFNQKGLMEELIKAHRVMQQFGDGHPHHVWLVIDAGSGQNGVHQARAFQQALPISGCVVTKLDGTAKGGMILTLLHELQLPVVFLGTGEGLEDLQPFIVKDFIRGLLPEAT